MPIDDRIRRVLERIGQAEERSGRPPGSVVLLAASKTRPVEVLQEAWKAGIRRFGENRVQELVAKAPHLPEAEWHMIGRLQRNKARRAVNSAELIHSLDSPSLAETLDRLGRERSRPVHALVEVNLGGEAAKGGIAPQDLPAFLQTLAGRDGLQIQGLMAIPPPGRTAEDSRAHFRSLADLARAAAERRLPGVEMKHLSMGMSADYVVAIEEGATIVRLGTEVFGPRTP